MTQIAIQLGGAVVNALAISESNLLFSILSGAEAKTCNNALAQLQIDREKQNERRAELADWVKIELVRQGHAQESFRNVDEDLQLYQSINNINLQNSLEKEPRLSDYYQPSQEVKNVEIIGITVGIILTGYLAYRYGKSN